GDGTFQPGLALTPFAGGGPNALATGDFNNDGRLDLVVTDGNLNVGYVLPGNGDSTFGAADAQALGQIPTAVAVAALARDLLADVVTRSYVPSPNAQPPAESVNVLLNTGQSRPNWLYVTNLYRDVLGRLPAPAEVSGWAGALEGGALTRFQAAY